MNAAIVLAGGVGMRLGARIPKQFIEVIGKPLIVYTLERFENHPEISAIEVVCHEDYIEHAWSLVERYGLSKVKWIVPGGDTFQDSVANGVRGLEGRCADADIVLVHYADCPLVSADVISDAIRVAAAHDCASPAMSSIDLTCERTDDDHSIEMINRDDVMCLQAPLAMRYRFAKWVYEEGERSGLLEEVEPHTQSLIVALGAKIWFSKNNRLNFKITTKEDMALFEAWVMREKALGDGESD